MSDWQVLVLNSELKEPIRTMQWPTSAVFGITREDVMGDALDKRRDLNQQVLVSEHDPGASMGWISWAIFQKLVLNPRDNDISLVQVPLKSL